jgi:parallel beta-helix repeat protein
MIAVMACMIGLFGCKKDSPTGSDDDEDPTVRITQPVADASVAGNVEIKAIANDNEGVTEVKFYVGGTLKGTDDTAADSEYTYTWDASGETPGSGHTIQAKAHDAGGNVGESVEITVYITGGGREHSGTISADETWYAADNPHVVTGDIIVEGGATLTIEAGVVVKFNAGTGFNVGPHYYGQGAIVADGSTNRITFTSNMSPQGPGDWDGITFARNTIQGPTKLKNCLIEYGGGNGCGNIQCDRTCIAVTDCEIRHSSTHGVYCGGNSWFSDFSNNTITLNAGYPIQIDAIAVHTIGLNTVTGNTNDGIAVVGGGVTNTCTWLNHGVPYIVTGVLNVQGGGNPVLTIAPGNTLKFGAGGGIDVALHNQSPGAIIADGSTDRITFTTSVSPAAPGNWNGITFGRNTIQGPTKLKNCLIEYGGGNGRGNIYCEGTSVAITDCEIRDGSKYGVYCERGSWFSDFSNNTITANAEYPLRMDAGVVHSIGSNTVTGNTKDGIDVIGGGVGTTCTWLNHGVPYIVTGILNIQGGGNPVVTIAPGNTLKFGAGGGIDIALHNQSPGALIADGSTGHISFTTSMSPAAPGNWNGIVFGRNTIDGPTKLNNCLIEYAGGNNYGNIYCENASPTITNSAINHSSHWGIYLGGDSAPTMSGNTFTGNVDGDVGP